jgi:flagellar hook-length control protein FliK
MNTAPLAAVPTDMSGLPPSASSSAPGTPTFSDMLASATSSLAAFALLPTSNGDTLSSAGNAPAPPKKDPSNDNAAVPIALPAPVQPPPTTSADASGGSSTTAPTAPSTAAAPQTQQGAQSAATGSAGTGGTSSGSAQTSNGVALPSMASELGTKIALGAQALLSQPSQVLATLPHGALQAAATTNLAAGLNASAHGSAAPDPTAVLSKLAASATIEAATPTSAPTALETALQSAASQAATAATSEAAVLTSASETSAQTGTDAGLGTTAAPALVPLPAIDVAANADTALPSTVASSALDQVAASLRQIGSKLGLSQIEIQLKPASLGAVDVKLELTHDGRVAAVISADRTDTLMQLQRGSGELQQALRDAGLQTDSGSLSFNLRGDAQTSDQSGRQPSYAAPQSSVADVSDDLLAVPMPLAGAGQSAYSGLLNIQV